MSDSNEESFMILQNKKKRKQCDNQNNDRLSDLPDFVLLHILSFLNTKQVVQTCVLSKRWKHLWRRISTLILHSSNFSTLRCFAKFASKIFTLRDTSTALHALDLDRWGDIEPQLFNQNEDRLSDLPDCVLLHILSFLNTKHVVRTCILSKRWTHLWKRIPTLKLHCFGFTTKKRFATFVSKILTLRDTETALHALDLIRSGKIEPQLLKKILNYVCSHNTNLQELSLIVHGDSGLIMSCVSSCHALTSLNLLLCPRVYSYTPPLFPKSLNLPLLTNLDLTYFTFCGGEGGCAEPFSAFTKLNSLVICSCKVNDAQILVISSETLVNLAIKDPLEKINLAIQNNSSDVAEIKLSTPNLYTFKFTGDLFQKICRSGLSSVKQVNIDDSLQDDASVEHGLVIFNWLLDFANVESLIVTSSTLQILSLVPDLLEVKLPSLCNLKLLEVELTPLGDEGLSQTIKNAMLMKAAAKSYKEFAKLKNAFKARLEPPAIPDGIVDFLRQNSPSAEVTMSTDFPYCFNLKQVKKIY